MKQLVKLYLLIPLYCYSISVNSAAIKAAPIIDDFSLIFQGDNQQKLRVSAYGSHIIRLQTAKLNSDFYTDDHYEMVKSHANKSSFKLTEKDNYWLLSPKENAQLIVKINKSDLAANFSQNNVMTLTETQGVTKVGNTTEVQFTFDDTEHFTGLGHSYYGREASLDLKGQRLGRNYGATPIEQAPLIVPFYLSSKGYGVFLNSTFSNEFSFGDNNEYSIAINDHGFNGQMDYFYIAGPKLTQVIDNYTQLTGRPRLPAKAMFGLQLSDKGHDHNSATPSNEQWWKLKITQHRAAGFPLDHVINDNRWRAAGGKRCESKLAWDKKRYPDPAAYQQWLTEQGLVLTLDFNRCIAEKSAGWKADFNLPNIKNIQFPNSAPDLTNAEFRQWFWHIFKDVALQPEQNFPGDALWIDEFDEQGAADKNMLLSNGRSSAEMRNYWFFLIAKALVDDGWDRTFRDKRSFVWVRGMTAGAQRYATLWSGDIYPNDEEMQTQVRAMQLAGLSGFPFWGHDAGGFFDWNTNLGPDEDLYQRWAAAFGSFAPIWKPHGMGQSRWPLDRSPQSQTIFSKYAQLRYTLMPYLYSAAHQASATGLPMARAMVLDYQDDPRAWQYDLQYMWGDALLVVPQTTAKADLTVWLPKGDWYRYNTNEKISGDTLLALKPRVDEMPLFAKAGSIIPTRNFAKSTAFIDKSKLGLDLYGGANGHYVLIEDDDKSNAYLAPSQRRHTQIVFTDGVIKTLAIKASEGDFNGANNKRDISLNLRGFSQLKTAKYNGEAIEMTEQQGVYKINLKQLSAHETHKITFR